MARRRRPPRGLTASGKRLQGSTNYQTRQALPWQHRALDYYDMLGEVRYASQFYGRMISRIRIFPAFVAGDGQIEPIEDGPPVELLGRIQDPGGGKSQVQASYGRLMFITGEGVLFGTQLGSDLEHWSFLWLDEIKEDKGQTWRLDAQRQPIEQGVGYRMWRPSPRHSDVADAPLRAVQDVCEELIVLTKAVMATALTRLTNGALLIPQEVSDTSAESAADEDPKNNPFMDDLTQIVANQIENPGAASARVPPIIDSPYEYMDRIRWLQMHDPATDYMEQKLRDDAIKRLALGLDFPPEVLLGMGDVNHWGSRQIVHDMWRSHGAPVAAQFCNDLSEAYLRPALRDEGFARADEVIVAYDDSQVVISPDRSDDADNAFDRGAVGYKGYRELKGIPESMAQNKDEHDEWLAWKLRDPQLIGGEPQQVPQAGPMPQPADQTPAEEGPPPPKRGRGTSRQESNALKILGAAELALIRCREIAGARLRTYQTSHPEILGAVRDKQNGILASSLGESQVRALSAPVPLKLVAGGSTSFKAILAEWHYPENQASALAEMLEIYAARTLFEKNPLPFPSGFVAHIERVGQIMSDMDEAA